MADKYNQADRDAAAKSGAAMPDGSYPIKDAEDLSNAIHAVGRGNADHDAIRKHIIARAKALGLSKDIPDNWNADGSLSEANAADTPCPTCDGTGKIKDGTTTCPDCGGSGDLTSQNYDEEMSNGALFEYHRNKAMALASSKSMVRRDFGTEQFELRAANDGMLKFSGYASLTNTPYPVSFYNETIQRGAFKRTLNDRPDVQMLINHGEGGSGMPIARTGKNMTLVEDERGLKVDADLDPEDPDVMLLKRKMDAGLIDQMSFAFQVTDQDWNPDFTERTIKAVSIHRGDVSVVNQGASSTTMASIRSLEDLRKLGMTHVLDALLEVRAGKTISSATEEVLTKIFESVVGFDDEMDAIIPALATLLGKPNPNEADTHNPDGSPKGLQAAAAAAVANNVSTTTDGTSRSSQIDLEAKRRREQQALAAYTRKAV